MKTEKELAELVAQLTLDEKLSLMYGDGRMSNHPVPRLGLQALRMNDGPRAVRLEDGRRSTVLPCGTSLASTFSREAAEEYGRVIGEECLATGTQVILGPGMNLMRSPLCSRNFEYMGEDPVLSGELAAGYIRGCQSRGVGACVKHYALNNQETCRVLTSANIDEQTMRELYLRGFEIAVRKAKPWMLMCSYNRINGIHASEHHLLQVEILKELWGFDGVVVSDWGAVHSTYQAVMNGMDLEMSGGESAWFHHPLRKLLQNGLVPMEVIDEHVLRILRLMDRTKCFEPEKRDAGSSNTAEHFEAAKRLAQEGTVLLKNNGILPLDAAKCRKIAVCGPSADIRHNTGHYNACGGSGAGHPVRDVTPLEALRAMLPESVEIVYAPGETFLENQVIPGAFFRTADGRHGLDAEFFAYDAATEKAGETVLYSRTDTEFDLHFGESGANIATEVKDTPVEKIAFLGRWKGYFIPEKTGDVSLAMRHLGYAFLRLFINGEEVLNSRQTGYRDVYSTYLLHGEAGRPVPVEVEFIRPTVEREVSFRLLYRLEEKIDFEALRDADAILYFGGSSHVYDREANGIPNHYSPADIPSLALPGQQDALLRKLAEVNPKLVVSLMHGSVLCTEPWIDQAAAVLAAWYPGQEGGTALAEMLFGKAAPAGRLCCTWGKSLEDYACHANGQFPGVVDPYRPYSDYLEKQAVGYRHFDTQGIAVRFPFGFGLSYTTFSQEVLGVCVEGRQVKARVRVTNTGSREGAAVIQLYLHGMAWEDGHPVHELVDFSKAHLQPGETRELELHVEERDCSRYDGRERRFRFAPGEYELQFGTSSRDIFDRRLVIVQ